MGKLHRVNENELTQLILDIGYNKDELLKAKSILEYSIKIRKAEIAIIQGGALRIGGACSSLYSSSPMSNTSSIGKMNNYFKK